MLAAPNTEHPREFPLSTVQPAAAGASAPASASTVRLNSFGGIFWGTFLGNLFATGLLMSQNYAQLGQHDKARNVLIYSSIAMLVILVLIFVLPEEVPVIAFSGPQVVAGYLMAKGHHEEFVIPHMAKGGAVHSNWRGAGIGLLIAVITFAATLPLLLVLA